MKEKISIQLKAALLLIVFSMNTVVGFACAIGVDIGLNGKRLEKKQKNNAPIHVHADGHKHHHKGKANKHTHVEKKSNEKDGCCNEKVVKFQSLEKNLTSKKILEVSTFTSFISNIFGTDIFNVLRAFPKKNIIRFFYPPQPDILLSIHKFQV